MSLIILFTTVQDSVDGGGGGAEGGRLSFDSRGNYVLHILKYDAGQGLTMYYPRETEQRPSL